MQTGNHQILTLDGTSPKPIGFSFQDGFIKNSALNILPNLHAIVKLASEKGCSPNPHPVFRNHHSPLRGSMKSRTAPQIECVLDSVTSSANQSGGFEKRSNTDEIAKLFYNFNPFFK